MLLIQPEQMAALEKAGLRHFEDRMLAHSRAFSPRLAEVVGKEQLRVAVRGAMQRAGAYGFTRRGPIRLYVELTLLRGSGFDTDPQYPALGEALRTKAPEMERAQRMYSATLEYRARLASGPGVASVYQALGELLEFARAPVAVSDDAAENMIYAMGRAYPRKAAYVGEEALQALIHAGISQCRKHGLSTFGEAALLMGLMFTLGHRCAEDPLYPWIGKTLRNQDILDPAARARRLEKEARAWLERMSGKVREPALA